MSRHKTYLLGIVSLVSGCSVFFFVDFHDVISALAQTSVATLIMSALFLIISNILAFFRFGVVLRSFGFHPGRRTLFLAFSIGQISNHFLLNILGQSLSRAMVLARGGVPFGAAIAATVFERLLAAGLLFVFSIAALAYLLNEIAFDLNKGGAYFIWMIGSMLIVGLVVIFVALRDEQRLIKTAWIGRSLPPIALTILSHLAMLAAYAVILIELQPERLSLAIVAALTIVMFTSSLPISFSGWGVRELSAATALSLVGVPSSLAVAAAFSVGLLTIVVMALFALVSAVMIRKAPPAKEEMRQTAAAPANTWDAALVKICALLCAVFIFFQIRVPLGTHNLSTNVADLPAITGGALVALLLITKRLPFPLPRYAAVCLLGVSLLILGGLAVAYFHDILGSWALINRGIGWLILLSYVAVPSAFIAMSGEHGRALIIRTAVTAAVAVCLLQLGGMITVMANVPIPRDVFMMPLQGYVDNQNAFSLQLAMITVLLAVGTQNRVFRQTIGLIVVFAIIGLTVYFTRSRTGFILIVAIALWMFGLAFTATIKDWVSRHNLRLGAIALCVAMVVGLAMPYAIAYFSATFHGGDVDEMLVTLTRPDTLGARVSDPPSEADRWMTISDGWKLFLDHPILGSGLGAYVQQRVASGQRGDVIHSVPVWLLAETGVFGFALILVLTWMIARQGWKLRASPVTAAYGWGLLATLAVITVGGLVHDFFYQRIFWFLFGILAPSVMQHAYGQGAGECQRTEPPGLPGAVAQSRNHQAGAALRG